jgi:hypothetical protein
MRNYFGLRRQLRVLGEVSEPGPSAELEARLLAAFRAEVRKRKRNRSIVGVAAALVFMASALLLSREFRGVKTHETAGRVYRPAARLSAPPVFDPSEFVALPYAQSDIPLEGAIVVRVDIPASQIGFVTHQAGSLEEGRRTVEAELLVGQDGVPRAVRVLK